MIEKTFLDRVPQNPGRVILIPVPGQANTFDMVRADSPLVEGTPLDKATFDSIIKSRLTGRYYMSSIQRTVASSRTGVTVNPVPQTGWQVVSLTRAINGEYIVTASSSLNDSYGLERATDGSQNTEWTSKGYLNNEPEWWQIQLPTPIAVKAIRANLEDLSGYGQNFVFQGSNNGTNWVDLTNGTFNNFTGMVKYSFANTNQYLYYRMLFTGYDEYSVAMVEFEIAEYDVSVYNNSFTLSGEIPTEWTTGQRILIQTPANFSTAGVLRNTLNSVNITTILQPSKRYELIYNGTAFEAKGV